MQSDRRSARLIFDISSIARWYGPAVGISRVEGIFARWAYAHRADAHFAFYDPEHGELREIRPQWLQLVLTGEAAVDLWGMPEPNPRRQRKSNRIPRAVRPAIIRLLRPRKALLASLERVRLTTENFKIETIASRLQELLMSEKYRRQMRTAAGTRRKLIPGSLFTDRRIELSSDDVVLNAGSGWGSIDIHALERHKQAAGFRFVLFCYDIIPLLFPEFYQRVNVDGFLDYFETAFPLADLVIFGSRRVEADAKAYCSAQGIALHATAVCPLGADAVRQNPQIGALPAGLERGRYALFVSTIEPRKGHRLLYNVWKQLLDDGIPQATGFKLVFLGRPGWMVDELLRELRHDPRLGDTLRLISYAEDNELAALYDQAAFCLYPSTYEGYGLPIAEAFSFAKPVIASTGGAIPEVVGKFSPCLDPKDEGAWYRLMRQWIEDPSLRAPYEAALRQHYRPVAWDEACAQLFATIDERLSRRMPPEAMANLPTRDRA